MTAPELLALNVDVIVVSYEQVEVSGCELREFPSRLEAFRTDTTGSILPPSKPNAPLHSGMWKQLGLPIKRLVLDEVQVVSKRWEITHKTVKDLFVKAVILLSGTVCHNEWHNVSGLVNFLQGHPFTTHKKFIKTFSSFSRSSPMGVPNPAQIATLQKFLQAFTVIRPPEVLPLGSIAATIRPF